ncbi:hypothetical protein HME9302_02592 [Alteripontixanthobacter maritimus]|uniref:HTH luxR-type domain-containing protein n=2 Tax=Alteripontixanthobacter maritimus TaxID=2161824 RepID=A0A369QAK7_9SPHN|nr:hypothetical protein HME9302_02592 [Alteripontixanthobacter maritimus]
MLGVTQSAVNKRIDAMRAKCGDIPRAALGRHYRAYQANLLQNGVPQSCDKIPSENLHLPSAFAWPEAEGKDTALATSRLSDSLVVPADAPWHRNEPSRVPEALDGEHASLMRVGAIFGIALGILLVALVAFTAMAALSDALSS